MENEAKQPSIQPLRLTETKIKIYQSGERERNFFLLCFRRYIIDKWNERK